ncbi:polysaccharide deacetylase family protein [Acidithiobacillus sp. AMEEHan]|uniref:polysaccharide deacetylase family protein n=1 Tax=Acidithiobacillus sp. AMEEHan TaxID=2994951 RepID=UPI0027E5AFF9|nr:polysaccharide deacetylase family protein [Acidithiobacillus sp. AMEEHan]
MPAIPILMYHNIKHAPPRVRLRGLYVSPRRFARQMALLAWAGYRGLSLADAMPYLRGERVGKIAVITFDDGYRDNLEHALPVLQQRGFSATCFVVSGALGAHNRWDAAELGVEKPLMTIAELRQWADAGMEVGAHTRAHVHLPALSAREAETEIAGSKQDLEDLLGRELGSFCYPYGEWGTRERDLVAKSAFRAAVSTRRGRARIGDDLLTLPRITVGGHHLPHVLPLQLWTRYEDRPRP